MAVEGRRGAPAAGREGRRLGRLVAILAGVAVIAVSAAAGISWWREARDRRAFDLLREKLAAGGGTPAEHHQLGLRLALETSPPAGIADEAIAHLEIAAGGEPASLRFGNDLRLACIRSGRYDRGIAFFERLTRERPDLPEPRLQLALSYVDKMPDHMMGIVGQGKLSKQSIALLARILEEPEPRDPLVTWSALYALGMNHLYWPKALNHAPLSVEAFRRCVDHQRSVIGGAPRWFILAYIGLGDALVKSGRHEEARRVWREGRDGVGSDARIEERLSAASDDDLTRLVDETRGLGVVVDTDLSVLWGREP